MDYIRGRRKINTVYFYCAVVFIVLVGGAFVLIETSREATAIRKAEEAVTNSLKTPATAEMCEKSKIVDSTSEKWFDVEGCVDAENGYGAMVRSEWLAEVYYDEDTKEWDVEVTFDSDEEDSFDELEEDIKELQELQEELDSLYEEME